jgi:hypothetical protein
MFTISYNLRLESNPGGVPFFDDAVIRLILGYVC